MTTKLSSETAPQQTLLERAARQALEALREYRDTQMISAPRKAIESLREALAEQAEQEQQGSEWEDETDPVVGSKSQWKRRPIPHKKEQEPVAWAISHSLGLEFGSKYPMQETKEAAEQMARQHMGAVVVTPLYAAPIRTKDPCNPLQDLTDDEIHKAFYSKNTGLINGIRAVIAADRAKNNLCDSANAEEKNK